MGKKPDLNEQDYIHVIWICNSRNFIPDEELESSGSSIEVKLIRKDYYTKLSDEAKEVIKIVTDRPIEFVKFAWNYDPQYAMKNFKKKKGRVLKKTKNYPKKLTKPDSNSMEKRLTNLNIIGLFFKYRWKQSHKFVEGVIKEIVEFVETL